jgi:hypothetical protein
MADRALDIYLNDHLAGATAGLELAEELRDRTAGTALGDVMTSLAQEIARDREVLVDLADRLGTTSNPVKQGVAWLAEKAARIKLSGASSGSPALGTFLGLEALALGVEGKACLWRSLQSIAAPDGTLATLDLDDLIERAQAQREILERERRAAGAAVLGTDGPA